VDEKLVVDLFLAVSQIIQSKLEEFDTLSEEKYDTMFYDTSENKMADIRDLIKECPQCHTIWIKGEGCNNVTCVTKMPHKDYLS
jgi:methionyl-tRNA synthetase